MSESLWAAYPQPSNLPRADIHDPVLPLVSIVTPSYNQGQFIRETIESVLTQDYPNIEHWVIDGGSTDSTLAVLREYEHDPRFHWISEPDKGQSDAINKGWRRCQGDILAWLCSDDLYFPGAVRVQVDYLLSHPNIDAVYGDIVYISADNRAVRKFWARSFDQLELLRINFIPQPSVFLRRELIRRTGPVDVSLRYYLDPDYWLRASLHSTFAYSSGEIAQYRLHEDSKTVSQIARFNPEIETVVERFLQLPEVSPTILQKQRVIRADLMLMIATNYARARQLKDALRYYVKSLRYHPVRPRSFWLVLTVLDAVTGLSLADKLSEKWLEYRSKH